MQKILYLPMTLIALAIISGCSTVPTQSLLDARNSYNTARTNPEITTLAPLELKDAGDTLSKADFASNEGKDDDTVNHLAYLTKQRVAIAEETAKRKTAEIAVTNAESKRTQVRLDARTAEADAAHQKIGALKEEQQRLLNELNAKQTERGMMITLGDVLFSTAKAQLKSGGMRNVYKLADFMNQYPTYKVSVEGHTDSRGSDEYNQDLSERRASAVENALVSAGISRDRISARGYGKGLPIAGNDSPGGRQMNRRVEIILSDSEGNIKPR
ncbi:MAG: OmpA family protein [Methylicorpusculum sp.]|uniref:OmpA family protein n=2 Tax=Methylicorpusculum sp. TaxID=2713644 RepID=UPI002720FD59|nr:OmpA family protein [Methylicorpusculum sp.]MDO8939768.1 OmpA family protein [Methylicorpusculum sp.]MDP2201878.1 OmpA family protein [Methylicorpusculum sp.]